MQTNQLPHNIYLNGVRFSIVRLHVGFAGILQREGCRGNKINTTQLILDDSKTEKNISIIETVLAEVFVKW